MPKGLRLPGEKGREMTAAFARMAEEARSSQNQDRQLMARAEEKRRAGLYRESVEILRRVINLDPKNVRAQELLGRVDGWVTELQGKAERALAEGRLTVAHEAFAEAAWLAPDNVQLKTAAQRTEWALREVAAAREALEGRRGREVIARCDRVLGEFPLATQAAELRRDAVRRRRRVWQVMATAVVLLVAIAAVAVWVALVRPTPSTEVEAPRLGSFTEPELFSKPELAH